MEKLTRDFFDRDTRQVARDLLGKYLVRVIDGAALTVRITETEAYIGRIDKACHAYGYKRTNRTKTLFAAPGTAYLYLIYGMYCCLNCVTEPEGEPAAVLLRGAEPVSREDAERISQYRYGCSITQQTAYQAKNFLNGPGKLCKGLALTTAQNGLSLLGETLFVCESGEHPTEIQVSKRIGIDYAEEAADFLWRYFYRP